MQLREFLLAVGETYDPAAGFDTPAQHLLSHAATELTGTGPADFLIRASGGQNPIGATDTPWVGFFDPDESTSPMEGLYVVWLLRASRDAWTLGVNIGTERLSARLKAQDLLQPGGPPREPRVRSALAAEATAIRQHMPPSVVAGWDTSIDLASTGTRQRRYVAATVLARTYPLATLPDEPTLQADLAAMCMALQEAVRSKRALAVVDPGTISTASATTTLTDTREYVFSPGIDTPGSVALPTVPIERTPRHESGLRRYGQWLVDRGIDVATNVHPRDFIVRQSPEWIGEYKVVYGSQVARATREAHSQLKEYRHFLYPPGSGVQLLAVFSAAVTDRRVAWLNSEGIAVVWWSGVAWVGCPIAKDAGLAA